MEKTEEIQIPSNDAEDTALEVLGKDDDYFLQRRIEAIELKNNGIKATEDFLKSLKQVLGSYGGFTPENMDDVVAAAFYFLQRGKKSHTIKAWMMGVGILAPIVIFLASLVTYGLIPGLLILIVSMVVICLQVPFISNSLTKGRPIVPSTRGHDIPTTLEEDLYKKSEALEEFGISYKYVIRKNWKV